MRLPLVTLLLVMPACTAELAPSGPKLYNGAVAAVQHVEGFGIDDDVDVLPTAALATVAVGVQNTGRATASGYLLSDTIERMIFQGARGWAPPQPGPPYVLTYTAPGPSVAPGATAPGSIPISALPGNGGCGLYRETLVVDSTDVVSESDERDNQLRRFFFVPTTQWVNITQTQPIPTVDHHHQAAVPVCTITYSPGDVPVVNVSAAPIVGSAGSTGAATLAADVVSITPNGKTHQVELPNPEVMGVKVTAITPDGCMVKQQTCTLNLTHHTPP
ncbi:MAG: hypothetical protein IT380_19535 [Myxococcales bacterium]|nr:hypothetical protein [Myxococcales bacterium]